MISRNEVTNAALVALRSTGVDVGDLRAPDGVPAGRGYGILEHPASPLVDGGDMADSNRHLAIRLRIRSVGVGDQNRKGAREQAEVVAHRLLSALVVADLTGTGWKVASITVEGTVTDAQSTVVNVVDDVQLWVIPTV